jgi:hypothetical protein
VLHAVRKIAGERQTNTELNQQLHVLEQTLRLRACCALTEHHALKTPHECHSHRAREFTRHEGVPAALRAPPRQNNAHFTEVDMIVLKATQDKVLAVLQSVAGIVERRHTLPILANVLIKKTGNALQLTTSDLEIQIRTTAELGGDAGDFTTTIGARKLIDILRPCPATRP